VPPLHQRIPPLALFVLAMSASAASAADQWIEVRSLHFTVTSNASRSDAASLAWQLEQVRSAVVGFWPWTKVDLNKPLVVLALKDETTLKALAPEYWEKGNRVRPTGVWVTGFDQHYMAIRTDAPSSGKQFVNPYTNSFFSYVSLILNQSLEHDLPLWCSRGLAGVLSNMLIEPSQLLVGAPIPWHLETMRTTPRLPIAALMKVTPSSREYRSEEGLERFDAQSWALVHFLMFGDNRVRQAALNRFINAVARGADANRAFAQELGRPEDLELPLGIYVSRNVFSAVQVRIDVGVKREGFTVRPLSGAESAGVRALFHAAMNRPAEARAAIADARKGDAPAPASYVAEGLLLDREQKGDDAQAAYARALEAGSTSSYAAYRLAELLWRGEPERPTLERIEKLLSQAIESNSRNAAASARLGEVRSILGTGDPLALVNRAISLEPSEAYYHLVAARVLWRQQKWDEASRHAQAAAALAQSEENTRAAREMIASLEQAKARAAAAAEQQTQAAELKSLADKCQADDRSACAAALPLLDTQCTKGNASACGYAAWLYDTGRGVTEDPARAAKLYAGACDAGERRACVALAALQARGRGVAKDETTAIGTLDRLCADNTGEACTDLAVILVSGQQPDLARARALLTRSCDARFERACELLKSLPK
jgi:TPR repeat protein